MVLYNTKKIYLTIGIIHVVINKTSSIEKYNKEHLKMVNDIPINFTWKNKFRNRLKNFLITVILRKLLYNPSIFFANLRSHYFTEAFKIMFNIIPEIKKKIYNSYYCTVFMPEHTCYNKKHSHRFLNYKYFVYNCICTNAGK